MVFIVKAETWHNPETTKLSEYLYYFKPPLIKIPGDWQIRDSKWLMFELTIKKEPKNRYYYITDLETGKMNLEWVSKMEISILLDNPTCIKFFK